MHKMYYTQHYFDQLGLTHTEVHFKLENAPKQ